MDSPKSPNEEILTIPFWKRWLICHIFMRKEWKVAKAYNKVVIEEFHSGNDELSKRVELASYSKWRAVYMLES